LCLAVVVMLRVRDWSPVEHVAEHMLQSLHSLTAQSTAQACALHTCVPDSDGHSAPPCATGTVMERARVCEPPPHDLVHAPQPAHEPTEQSTGHACELQVRDSVRCAHC